jgi:methionyl-tRNA formyltransferase
MTTPAETTVIFMGTPAFAVPALTALHAVGYRLHVVTQPDRAAGRGSRLTAPPVKEAALARGLPVLQPATLRDPAVVDLLRGLHAGVIVVAGYGELLRRDVLEMTPHGCVNIHPSLLPRWRGPTPIPAAIRAGDAETGVSIMLLDAGKDSGPLLAQVREPIAPDDTAATLGDRLARRGADLLIATLPRWLDGAITPQPQDPAGVTTCGLLRREDGLINWARPAEELAREVRAYTPWPGTTAFWEGRRLKVLEAAPQPRDLALALWENNPPGTVLMLSDEGGRAVCAVRAGEGWLELLAVQLEGRAAMPVVAFVAGYPGLIGSSLAETPPAAIPEEAR